ncbi:MAG: endonuclease/exonuclease/phosphatase family protein [Chloroflexota bacterium]
MPDAYTNGSAVLRPLRSSVEISQAKRSEVVVMGDFNATPWSQRMMRLKFLEYWI